MTSKQLSDSIEDAMQRAKSLISSQSGNVRQPLKHCHICYENTTETGYRAKEGAELMTSILQVSLESICNAHGIHLPNRPSSERFVVCSSCEGLTKYGSEILKTLEDLKRSLDNLRDQIAEKIQKGRNQRPAKRTIRTVTEYERLWPAICEVFHQAHTPCVVDLGLLSNDSGDYTSMGTSPTLRRKSPTKTPSTAQVGRANHEQVTPGGSNRVGVSTRRTTRLQKASEDGVEVVEELKASTRQDSDFYVGDELNELVESDGGDNDVASDYSPDEDEAEYMTKGRSESMMGGKQGRARTSRGKDRQKHVRGYACLDCSKLFPSVDILKIHERETDHNGEDLNAIEVPEKDQGVNILNALRVEMDETNESELTSNGNDGEMDDEEVEESPENVVSASPPPPEEPIPLESLVYECDKCDKTLTYKDTKRTGDKFQIIEESRSYMFSTFSELCSFHYRKCANVRLYKPVNRRAILWKSNKKRIEQARKSKLEALRKGNVEIFLCEVCNDEFSNMEDYTSHKQVHISGEWNVCAVCQSNYQDDRSLQIHMSRVHGVERNEDLRYTCKVCREIYNPDSIITDENIGFSKFEIFAKIHEANCASNFVRPPAGPKQHKCRFCDAHYTSRTGLKIHEVKKHTKEFEYFCDQCGKGFVTNAHLIVHQKDHAGIRPFKCTLCPADFNHRTRLTEHMRLHTGERPCVCSHCGAQFRTLAILRKHELIHAEPEEHRCLECNKMYRSARKLEYHINTVHLKKWIISRKKSQMRIRHRKKVAAQGQTSSEATVVIKIVADGSEADEGKYLLECANWQGWQGATMEQEEDQGPNMHPLLIDVVLEALAKHVRSKDLPSFRLVCKKWNTKIANRFHQESTVRLSDTSNLSQFVRLLRGSYYESTFRNFSITRISLNDPQLETVFEICGSTMTGLTLGLGKEDIDICQFRELLLHRAPNLQKLSFDTLDGLPEEVTNHAKLFPQWLTQSPCLEVKDLRIKLSGKQKLAYGFMHQLLKSCNGLQCLTYSKAMDGYSESLKVLEPLKDSVALSSLSCISLGKVENDSLMQLNQLALLGLRLKKFDFESLEADCIAEVFNVFLENQKDSLEELTLNEYNGRDDLMVKIPVMTKVVKFTFSAFEASQIVPRTPLNYYKSFPNLQEVLVYGWQNSVRWELFFSAESNLEPMRNVWKLQPPYRMKEVELFKRLLAIFPVVTSMDITSPSNSILQEVWTSCGSLKVLELFLDWNNVEIDRILTGLTQSDCDALRDEKSSPMTVSNDLSRIASIIDLKDLHTFVCEMYEPWRDGEPEPEDPSCLLTDASVLGAFCCMPQLHNIYVARSDITPVSVSLLQKILPYFACIHVQGPFRKKLA